MEKPNFQPNVTWSHSDFSGKPNAPANTSSSYLCSLTSPLCLLLLFIPLLSHFSTLSSAGCSSLTPLLGFSVIVTVFLCFLLFSLNKSVCFQKTFLLVLRGSDFLSTMGKLTAKNPWDAIRMSTKRFYYGCSDRVVDGQVDARIIKTGFDPEISRLNFQLKDLVRTNQIAKARQLFDEMACKNTCSVNMMVSGYVKSHNLSRARELFDSMLSRNEVSWTVMIGGYSQNNHPKEAFSLYMGMCRSGIKPDHITFATLLSGFDDTTTLKEVLQTHSHIIRF